MTPIRWLIVQGSNDLLDLHLLELVVDFLSPSIRNGSGSRNGKRLCVSFQVDLHAGPFHKLHRSVSVDENTSEKASSNF